MARPNNRNAAPPAQRRDAKRRVAAGRIGKRRPATVTSKQVRNKRALLGSAIAATVSATGNDHDRRLRASSRRLAGIVQSFNLRRGFGSIVPGFALPCGRQKVFVHYSQLVRPPTAVSDGTHIKVAKGQKVEFCLAKGPKGFFAKEVTGPGRSHLVTRAKPARKNLALAANQASSA